MAKGAECFIGIDGAEIINVILGSLIEIYFDRVVVALDRHFGTSRADRCVILGGGAVGVETEGSPNLVDENQFPNPEAVERKLVTAFPAIHQTD